MNQDRKVQLRDPMDELQLMDEIQIGFEQRERDVVGKCDPARELCSCGGDPGRGKIDAPGSGDGWTEAGANPEEKLASEVDDLVGGIEDDWDLGGIDL